MVRYWGPPPQVYQNLIVLEWKLDDVRDGCSSFQAVLHYERFGMAEENTPSVVVCNLTSRRSGFTVTIGNDRALPF